MYLQIFLIICLVNLVYITNAATHFKITKLDCAPSPKYFINCSCYLKAINRYKTEGFMETYIIDVLRNVSVNVGLYARNDANIYKPYLVNFTSNICKFLDKRASGLYLNSLMQILKTYSNVNQSCPYRGYLIAKNLKVDTYNIPLPPVPKNSYKFLLIFYEGYPMDYIGTVSIYVDLINSK